MFAKLASSIPFLAYAFFISPNASAQDVSSQNRPILVDKLVNCGSIDDNKKRLACFDANIEPFISATEKGDIIVEDKASVEKERADSFGLKTAKKPDKIKKNIVKLNRIESKITSARLLSSGKWRFALENGSVWQQTGTRKLRYKPEKGLHVTIKKGALSSFNASIKDQRIIKVKRIR